MGKAMRILVFSDIHGDRAALEALMERDADLYIAAGDLVSWGRGLDALAPVLARRAPKVWVLPGNHEHETEIEAFCARHGLNALHGRHFERDGWRIAGLGHSSPTPFNTPGDYTEEELAERLARFAGLKPLILVCHCPPLDTPLDRAAFGRHIGSRAVREFLDREQPAWFACGHVHEAAGTLTRLGATQAVNAGKGGFLIEVSASGAEGNR
jgi:Icc-related predicted phosphoesterase